MSEQAKGPLTGVKVLDVTMNLAGPAAAMHLADFGADVIKVERPGRGDDTRRFVPAFKGESSSFMMINRNKRGLAIDLKSEQGKEVFRTLVKQVDVLVENFLKDTMNRLGLGLSKEQIVQCIEVLDKDGDGEVSLEEFMELVKEPIKTGVKAISAANAFAEAGKKRKKKTPEPPKEQRPSTPRMPETVVYRSPPRASTPKRPATSSSCRPAPPRPPPQPPTAAADGDAADEDDAADDDAEAGAREITGGDQAVVPAAQYDDVIVVGLAHLLLRAPQ